MIRRLLAAVGGLLLAAAAVLVPAQDLAPIPPLKTRVTDLTGTLSAEQSAELERRLADFEARKGSQIAVLVVPTTAPEAIEQYGIRLADAWKLGRKGIDDGVILLVAKNDRRLRLEVGYGLEGAIPDAIAQRVIREVISPRFRAGDFYGGVVAGAQQLMGLIDGEKLPPPPPRPEPQGEFGGGAESLVLLLVLTMVLGGALTAVLGRLIGSAATGGVVGLVAWTIAGALAVGIGAGFLAFAFSLILAGSRGGFTRGTRGHRGGWTGGGWSGGGWGGGGGWSGGGGGGWSGGGGFSGGGGGFDGGGASGGW
jgi:uncharacterized protein